MGRFTATSGDSQLGFALGNEGCVTLCGPCHLHEDISSGKRRIMETQIFFTMQKYNLPKIHLKKPKSFKIS
jgi:hypothetical protein